MKIKTSELKDKALDYVVAKIESGIEPEYFNGSVWITTGGSFARVRRNVFEPSTKWSQGGPIIEREGGFHLKIWLESRPNTKCEAHIHNYDGDWIQFGPTPLIAAMRCFCASRLGDEVEVPDDFNIYNDLYKEPI